MPKQYSENAREKRNHTDSKLTRNHNGASLSSTGDSTANREVWNARLQDGVCQLTSRMLGVGR